MTREEFEKTVEEALKKLPKEFSDHLENIQIAVEDLPKNFKGKEYLLLGEYTGIPLEKRGSYYAGVLPDIIVLYQKNIEKMCRTKEEMIEQIQKTVLHEIGHYFGLNDKKLRKLGY